MTTPPGAPVLDLRDVEYWYPDASRRALAGIDWTVAAGEVVVLAGPSGSGKSTLLRCLNGLVPHFAGGRFGGSVRVGGVDTRTAGPRTLSGTVGFVFQDPEAQGVADVVEDEIAFGLEQAAVARREMAERIDAALGQAGIAHLRARRLATLSGGERQRVAVASALARRPEVLVLDEPTSQLDPWGAADVLAALQRLAEERGVAIVLAEHRLERVAGVADRLALLRDGEIAVDEAPARALLALDDDEAPPLARLARALGWAMAPLTVGEARTRLGERLPAPVAAWRDRPATGGAPVIALERVSAGFGSRALLRDISLSVGPGDILAVMGRNGAGKTTLLRTVLGLHRASAGRIAIAGRDATRLAPGELAGVVGYVPQEPARLLFADRVADDLAFTLRHRPRACDWPARDPMATLEALGIAHLADRHHRDISAGERERAALAAVLVAAPRIVVLDEPTRGMDQRRKHALAALLERERAAGATIVLATHDVDLVAACATRVVVLEAGAIVADGPPREVLSGAHAAAPQIGQLIGGGALTVADALVALGVAR